MALILHRRTPRAMQVICACVASVIIVAVVAIACAGCIDAARVGPQFWRVTTESYTLDLVYRERSGLIQVAGMWRPRSRAMVSISPLSQLPTAFAAESTSARAVDPTDRWWYELVQEKIEQMQHAATNTKWEYFVLDVRGWPLPIMVSEFRADATGSSWAPDDSSVVVRQWATPRSCLVPAASTVSSRLFWTWLVLDVGCVTAAWIGITCLVRTLVQRIRRGRGMCTCCGYVLRGSPSTICPECGTRQA